MNKYVKNSALILSKIKAGFQNTRFCNIAEGTHAGHITLVAKSDIAQANLLVKLVNGQAEIAQANDIPVGVCTDCADAGDVLDVALAGCAESTLMCVASTSIEAGDVVYSQNYGKVGTSSQGGAFKVGVALTSATSGSVVEIDPQGFGSRCAEIVACGTHSWQGSSNKNSLPVASIKDGDIAFATIAKAGASEKAVNAAISSQKDAIEFSLDSNGVNSQTTINWILIRK